MSYKNNTRLKELSKIKVSTFQHCLFCFFIIIGFFNGCKITHYTSQKPVKIIFDTDMGSDCDDAGALALLHKYADMDKAEIIGCIYSSGKVPYGAGVVEAINNYYGRPDIPVGANHDDEVGDPIDKMNAGKLVRDTVAFGNTIIFNSDTREQTRLNRKMLSENEDHSLTYITVGHTKALYDLLVSEPDDISPLNGRELIRKKINRWIALGALGANNKEGDYKKDWNFFFNETALYTKYLVDNFPVTVYYIDAGTNVMTGGSLKHTPRGNIVRTIYRDWLWEVFNYTLDDQRPSWDLAAVYFAVEGTDKYLINSGTGMLDFDVEKGCRWVSDGDNRLQYFIEQKEQTDESFAGYLNKMIGKPPLLK